MQDSGLVVVHTDGVTREGQTYLGTFTFRPSGNAAGEFAVTVDAGDSTFLPDSYSRSMTVSATDAAIDIAN